ARAGRLWWWEREAMKGPHRRRSAATSPRRSGPRCLLHILRALRQVTSRTHLAPLRRGEVAEACAAREAGEGSSCLRPTTNSSNLERSNPHFATSAPGHTKSLNRSTGSFALHAIPRNKSTRKSGSSNDHE